MNKIFVNIKYKIKQQLGMTAWYLSIYAIVMFVLYFILIKTNAVNKYTSSISYRLWGIILFQFAVCIIKFKEDFDFFLILGNTRQKIFLSTILTATVFSILFSGLIMLERFIFDFINEILGFIFIKDIFQLFSPYNTNNLFLQFLFFFLLCANFSVIGILLGILFYRYGKKFILAFWLTVTSIPIIFIPVILWILYQKKSLSIVNNYILHFLKTFNVLTASGLLFLFFTVFCLTVFLLIRKLPQK